MDGRPCAEQPETSTTSGHQRLAPRIVLNFAAEVASRDSRTLRNLRPVGYVLVRHVPPPDGVTVDPRKRPLHRLRSRAGHGPGIGGMKHDSEIGVARGPSQCISSACRKPMTWPERSGRLPRRS